MFRIGNYIATDANVCHGKPCFKGTRVMVFQVLEMLADGETPEQVIENAYPQLTKRHIQASLYYVAQLMGKLDVSFQL